MFDVSEKFKKSIKGTSVKSRISGTITLTDEKKTVIPFSDKDIIEGSLSINNKCLNNNDFSFGAVYVGEMSATFYNERIDRYSLYNAEITLSYFLIFDDGSEEEVPLGTYWVDEATRTKKLIQVKCYDAMTKFDVNLEEETSGTAFELLAFICEKIGVELGTSEAELSGMCNPQAELSMNSERVGTYRDMISYISTVMGGFATINRFNQLVVKQFHLKPDDTVSSRRRTSSTIHDYETFFSGVTVRFIANTNYYPYTEEEQRDGLILNLGDIPIIQGLEEFKHEVLHNIFEVVKNVRYVPSSFSMVSDPSIELGDGLTLENVNGGQDNVFCLVTGFNWTYHKEEKIYSEGSDALLYKVSSKAKKDLENLEVELSTKNIVVKNYTNSDEFRFTKETEIIKMSYSASVSTTAILLVTIPITMSADGNLKLTYFRNAIQAETITKYLEKGEHFVTFSNYFPCEANGIYRLVISAQVEAVESDIRKHEAKIVSLIDYVKKLGLNKTTDTFDIGTAPDVVKHTVLKDAEITPEFVESPVDMKAPVAFIPETGIKVSLFGQGLNASTKWDGTFDVSEMIQDVELPSIMVDDTFREILKIGELETPYGMNFSERLDGELPSIIMGGINESLSFKNVQTKQTASFSLNDYVVKDSTIHLKTDFEYYSQPYDVDEGILIGCQIQTSDKESIESLGVTCR